MVRIRHVSVVGEHTVRLELTDGSMVERNLEALLSGRIFEVIKSDGELFRQVTVSAGTLAWPNGIDLDPDMIIWGGPPPADARKRTG